MGSFNIFVCLLLSSAVQTYANSKHCCKCCAPNSTAVGAHKETGRCAYNGLPDRCLTRYGVEADCTAAIRNSDVLAKKAFPQCYDLTSPAPTAGPAGTTTMTAMDSSASSGSGESSASLASFGSGPGDSSSGYSSGSFNQGSFGSDPSGSASSGSTASGSFGSQLPIWLWIVLLLLCCCCLAGAGGASMGGKKPKKKKSKKSAPAAPAAPAPVAEVLPEVEPLMMIPPLMPLQTNSAMMPSYQMVQQPMTTSYAAPMTYAQPAAGYNFASTGQVV